MMDAWIALFHGKHVTEQRFGQLPLSLDLLVDERKPPQIRQTVQVAGFHANRVKGAPVIGGFLIGQRQCRCQMTRLVDLQFLARQRFDPFVPIRLVGRMRPRLDVQPLAVIEIM